MERFKSGQTDLLVRALLAVQNPEEVYQLLEDLMTIREIQDLAQRVEVASLLRRHVTYTEIAQKTGVSTATISRVNRALTYGAGGYELALGRLDTEND